MGKVVIIIFLLIIFSATVISEEVPSISFTSPKCDNTGILSFKADYEWNGYKGGYVYLNSVKVDAVTDGKTIPIKGWWYKFKTKDFVISDIKLNSPTAYFFSKPNSLKEGSYEVTIDYAISRNNIERFKNQFVISVSCPKQREVIKGVEKVEVVEKVVEEEEEKPIVTTVEEPPLISKNAEGYVVYYVLGLLITIFIISTFAAKKFYKKHPEVKKKPSSRKVENLFERKS